MIPEPLNVSWESGTLPRMPNILRHNVLRDFAVDDIALRVLAAVVDREMRVYAKLIMGDIEFSVIQATAMLDVVDVEKSIPSPYSWADISFPHIPEIYDSATDRSFFRVPNRGIGLSVFVGNGVKQAYDIAGLTGWLFNEARVLPDEG